MKKYLLILIALCLTISLTACGEKKNEENNETNNEPSAEIDDSTGSDAEESIKNYELYSDSTKMVFKNGSIQSVYYYSGDKITALHTYTDCGSAAAANYALAVLEKGETIKKAYVDGKYLIIEYAESEYEGLSAKEIKALYSYMEQIQDKG